MLLTRWRFETAQEMVSIIQTLSLPEVALASLASDPSPDFRLSAAFCLAGCRVTMKHRIRCRTASQCCLSSKPRQGILEHGTRVFMERQGNYFLSALAFPRPLFGICALVVVRYAIWGCVCLGSPFWGVSAKLLKTPPNPVNWSEWSPPFGVFKGGPPISGVCHSLTQAFHRSPVLAPRPALAGLIVGERCTAAADVAGPGE